jgi:glucose-6-phosphate 1-dehydrogenase
MVIESKIPKEAEIPPTDFVIVGGTGDLALRKIFPALFHRFLDGQIPESCALIAAARHTLPKKDFLDQLRPFCDEVITSDNEADWLAFGDRVQIIGFDVQTGEGAEDIEAACIATAAVPRVFYFAISPTLFADACHTLERTGLKTEQTRLVVEKPMGHDLQSAEALDDSILAVFEERQIYRIDHYLGKETVQNLMALRFANSIFESLWSNAHIDHVQISVAEEVGVGSRASYYDDFGALRDMVQNHLLQLLCLVAMEPPSKFVADQVRDEKLRVLRALKPITRENFDHCVKLGQYTKGLVEATPVDSYTTEVGHGSDTETFAALRCEISNWRWSGVPFYLRTGKRLAGRASEIVITFKRPPHNIFEDGPRSSEVMEPNRLVIRLQPNEGLKLSMTSKEPGPGGMRLFPASLNLSFNETFKTRLPEAYERLLMDVARGNQTLFMRSDEVEAAWAFIDPIVDEAKRRQPEKYTAGTWGPVSSFELMTEYGHRWIEPEVDG